MVALAENGDAVIIDGDGGHVHLRPMPEHQRSYEEKVRFRARRQEQFRALRAVEPVTKDGERISLLMNAGLLVDLPQLAESGAEGIGLFRTELQFMIASTMPKAEEQESFYRNVIKQAGDAAGHFPHPRYRRRQGRAPISAGTRKKTRRSAGARSGCRSTGRACCARNFAPCLGPRPAAS